MNQSIPTRDPAGAVPMVKINGARVRAIRESKGLTQLYLATAVGVTTDTISRWENRRYPTIKKENGLKLAEALETSLEDFLDTSTDSSHADENKLSEKPPPQQTGQPKVALTSLSRQTVFPLLGVALLVLLAVSFFMVNGSPPQIAAHRLLPNHTAPGQPFPVAITVTCDSNTPVSLILKETLPPGSVLLSSSPPSSAFSPETGEIKWLRKVSKEQVFVSLIKIDGELRSSKSFSGTLASRSARKEEIVVAGGRTVLLSPSHWADTDSDGMISDEEILMVHDLFSEIDGLALDIDQIEEMWLGSGYVWQPEKNTFQILE